MTKAKISEYDAVAANNTDVNGVNIAEGCPPSGMNNMGREIMAALKRFQTGADGDSVTVGGSLVVSNTLTAGPVSATTLNTSGAVVFNDAGADVDFRVEGDTDANLLFVDAGNDRVGIGTSSPTRKLTVSDTDPVIGIVSDSTAGVCQLAFGDPDDDNEGRIVYYNDGDYFTFSTAATERMRIDSDGDVGIGTSAPSSLLHISGGSSPLALQSDVSLPGIQFLNSSAALKWVVASRGNDSDNLYFSASPADLTGPNIASAAKLAITQAGEVIVNGTTGISSAFGALTAEGTSGGVVNIFRNDTSITTGNALGYLRFYGNDTTSNTPTQLAYIGATASGTHAAGDNPTDLVFGCTNDGSETVAEFARLGQGGASARYVEVKQPTLTDANSVRVTAFGGTAGTLNRTSSIGVYKHSGITNACGYLDMDAEDGANNFLWADNSDVLRISTTASNIGTTGGTVVGTQTSDERLKDISGPVTYGLNEVLAIEPIAFTMKDDPNIAKIGFSAQQVQPIVPEAVYDTKECIDGYTENEETKEQIPNSDRTKLAMEYTQLIPVLVNAVKELKAKLDTVKAELAALKGQ